jgi:hypothetical protein
MELAASKYADPQSRLTTAAVLTGWIHCTQGAVHT